MASVDNWEQRGESFFLVEWGRHVEASGDMQIPEVLTADTSMTGELP